MANPGSTRGSGLVECELVASNGGFWENVKLLCSDSERQVSIFGCHSGVIPPSRCAERTSTPSLV